jgi:hypothetical protein
VSQVQRIEGMRKAYETLLEKREGRSPFGCPRYVQYHNTEMDFKETGCQDVDCIYVAQVRDE